MGGGGGKINKPKAAVRGAQYLTYVTVYISLHVVSPLRESAYANAHVSRRG